MMTRVLLTVVGVCALSTVRVLGLLLVSLASTWESKRRSTPTAWKDRGTSTATNASPWEAVWLACTNWHRQWVRVRYWVVTMSRLYMTRIATCKTKALVAAALDLMFWEAGRRVKLGSAEVHRITSIGRGLGAGKGAAVGGCVLLELRLMVAVKQIASKAISLLTPALVVVISGRVIESNKHVLDRAIDSVS